MPQGLHPEAERVYAGTRVDLRVKRLSKRDGGTRPREIADVADAVCVLALMGDSRRPSDVVLIRNERFAVKQTLWELPAGTLEPGEDPAKCAARELQEETGFRPGRVERLVNFWASPGFSTERMHAFVATDLTETAQNLDDTERIEPVVVPWHKALRMCRTGELGDAKSIATLMWYAGFVLADESGTQGAQETQAP